MLDLIFSVLRVKNSSWMNAFLEGRNLTGQTYRRSLYTELLSISYSP